MQQGYEWDDAKNRENIAKHGIDFADIPKSSSGRCWSA
jgi:uncharacterized DUF497 family protein